ncbi:hypothetical protein DPV78_008545 [Talaromyces pinophilus]|nr:hypothetical protein DPV78_008545 [Talaromyces pinophilus]
MSFRQMLIRDHHAQELNGQGLWCNITGEYMEESMVESFELFPQALGYDVMLEIFGTSGGSELYSPRNGLLISKHIITYFRNFSIVIVPIGYSDHGIWQTVVLNEQLLNETQPKTAPNIFNVIHGKELTFKGRPRPAARYAYFHYAVGRMLAIAEKNVILGMSLFDAAIFCTEDYQHLLRKSLGILCHEKICRNLWNIFMVMVSFE